MDSKRQTQIKQNRERISPIIESIIFRQNIALRGHRDQGRINIDEDERSLWSSSTKNEGNFRELLRFRVKSGDTALKDYLEKAAENAKYTSAPVQNQIIDCCGKICHGKIKVKAKAAIYYSIGFDETTDSSDKSQMTITIKFIDGKTSREDFLGFHDLHDMNYGSEPATTEPTLTGEVIGKSVVKTLTDNDLDPLNCVGIGTDGCSVMSSLMKGAAAEVQKVCVNAVWTPCYNSSLNLTLSKTSQVKAIRNCMDTLGEVVNFFQFPEAKSCSPDCWASACFFM